MLVFFFFWWQTLLVGRCFIDHRVRISSRRCIMVKSATRLLAIGTFAAGLRFLAAGQDCVQGSTTNHVMICLAGESCACSGGCPVTCRTTACQIAHLEFAAGAGTKFGNNTTRNCSSFSYQVGTCLSGTCVFLSCPSSGCPAPYSGPFSCGSGTYPQFSSCAAHRRERGLE